MATRFIQQTDAYKQTHAPQYPEGTRHVYSYLESRGGAYKDIVFFGLQAILLKYFVGSVVSQEDINYCSEFCRKVFGASYFNIQGWQHILNKHNGKLPLQICAIPEGSVVSPHTPLLTVVNTDPEVPWLTNFVESILLHVWYPTTVATLSYNVKRLIQKHCENTGCDISPFHLNDFGYRGSTCPEAAAIGGMGHLLNFLGTDTLPAIQAAMDYYGADVCGYSVAASEHSTISSHGEVNEFSGYRHILNKYPKGILSMVSDTYNIYKALEFFGTELKESILSRDGKWVVRPDSGDPPEMCLKVVQELWKYFAGTINRAGFKVLNPKVGVIYGDGININTIDKILSLLAKNGFAAENVVFGMGGGLLQQVDRDTCKFAIKCSAISKEENRWDPVYKNPITDPGKKSKRGILKIINNSTENERNISVQEMSGNINYFGNPDPNDMLRPVFVNGELVKRFTFDEVKANID